LEFDFDRIAERLSTVAIHEDLADPRVQVRDVHDLVSHLLLGPDELRVVAGEGQFHTDDHPVIYYRAPLEMLNPDFTRQNLDLIYEASPGACAYVPEGPARNFHMSRIELAYRRWRLVNAQGTTFPFAAQADVCATMIRQ
jgi:hypothetical protein